MTPLGVIIIEVSTVFNREWTLCQRGLKVVYLQLSHYGLA
jgi:hypothetical protein